MTNEQHQHYGYDDDSAGRLQQHLDHHHYDRGNSHNNGNSYGRNDFQTKSRFDPCQAYSNETCIDACQTMSTINQVAMCGGVWDSERLSKFHNYFNLNHEEDGDGLDHHSSPYLYSPSAPVGPQSCEYCGRRNTDDCPSNLPDEYLSIMGNGINGDSGLDRSGNFNSANAESCAPLTGNDHIKRNTDNKAPAVQDSYVCHRPKLFFLKKRPPFATPEGWNPVTEYRTNLFEPPSSVEGMGRGWGEVRGHLGNHNAGGGVGGGGASNTRDLNRSYTNSGCGSSACGGGGAETEISFSSATGGGGGDRGTNVTTSDGGRSLSPVQWVSGLMGALSPS